MVLGGVSLAKADFDLEDDKESFGGFTKFLFFVTPIIFTVVLLAVVLTLLSVDFRADMISLGNKIPIVKNFVPDPEEKNAAVTKTEPKEKTANDKIKELQEQIATQEAELKQANERVDQQQEQVNQLQGKLEATAQDATLQAEADAAEQVAEYQKEVKKLANIYAGMSPSKAAAIFSNLTTEEIVQMLQAMSNENKVSILEKMDAKRAAEVSILLKDVQSSEVLAIAALQSRLKKDEPNTSVTPSADGINKDALGRTFAGMNATNAAKIILQTAKVSTDKALNILSAVDDTTRAGILEAMSKEDLKQTSVLLNKLLTQ